MALHICLAHNVHTVLIAEPVKIGVIAVMRGTDGIDIVLLHLPDIFFHCALRNSLAVEWVGIVAVNTFEKETFAVDSNRLPALCGNTV